MITNIASSTISFLEGKISQSEYLEHVERLDKTKELKKKLSGILPLEDDEEKWAKFLSLFVNEISFNKIKSFSPFKNDIFIVVDYKYALANYLGDIHDLFREILWINGSFFHSGRSFVVALPKLMKDGLKTYEIDEKNSPKLTKEQFNRFLKAWRPKFIENE